MIYEGKSSIWLGGRAELIDPGERDLAWAERSIKYSPFQKWVLGKYVEADTANANFQKWDLKNMTQGQPTITHAPMNLLHQPRRIVGHFVDTELLYPETAAEGNPFIEALGVFYRYYFPEELAVIERAHAEGNLYFSMECVGRSVTCESCQGEYDYRGPQDPSYCSHINNRESARLFNDPVFLAGALIVPPAKPGWKNASVQEISELLKENAEECELAYKGVKEDLPEQSPQVWEALMTQIVFMAEQARDFNTAQRKSAAKKGQAMKDGSFPIQNAGDLKNAIGLAGKAKNPAAAKAHIKRRAAALGLTKSLPDGW